MNNSKMISMVDYKDEAQEKRRKIKEFELGLQPVVGCTCERHTDPDALLSEREVTEHYLKDRKRYAKDLKEDPMEKYMEVFKNLTRNIPLIRLSRDTDLADTIYQQKHINLALNYYKQFILGNPKLTEEAIIKARDLKMSYARYKELIVRRLVGVYVLSKARIIRLNYGEGYKKGSNFSDKDTLDIDVYEAEGYAQLINEHFNEADMSLKNHVISTALKTIDDLIDKKLNGEYINEEQIKQLEYELNQALILIKQVTVNNKKRDYKEIKSEYEEAKDNYSIEEKAEALIDLELRSRQIDGGYSYEGEDGFTVNNSTEKLVQTIGIERVIEKLSTKELEILYEKIKAYNQLTY